MIFQLENHIFQVKKLTEEREKLTIDFKDENDELRNTIKALEREIDELRSKARGHKPAARADDTDSSEGSTQISSQLGA